MPVPRPAQATSVLTGEVFQENGKPLSDAEVSRFWVLGTSDGNGARAYAGTHTDVTGRFSLPIKQEDLPADLIVYTNDRRQAAIAHVETAASPVTISLQPVQRLHLNAKAPQLGGDLNGTRFLLQTTTGAPLAQLFGNEVDVPFPLGDYRLSLSSADTLTTMRTIHVATGMPSSLHITLALSAMAQHFGEKPPQLDTALIDSQGRLFVFPKFDCTTLLYFWADWCGPCIAEGIPHLLQFASLHRGDRFQIIAIHENGIPQPTTAAAFQKSVQHLQQSAWKQPLSFPFLFDTTGKVTSDWGLSTFPTYALIDAQGHLQRKAGLEELEAIMRR